ncbi:MAG: fatty acid desaturase [Parasphingorhabdus sp.]|jgi:fatty acid desaturase
MEDFVGRSNLIPAARLKELREKSDFKGLMQTISHFGAICITAVGLYSTWGTWLAIPFFMAHGILLNYLFAAQHEFNHYTAFKTRSLNDICNRITGFILLYPRNYERWFHFEHHRHTQNWDKDPELLTRGGPYTLASYIPYLFGITYWTGRIKRLVSVAMGNTALYFTEKQSKSIVKESRIHLAVYILVIIVSLYLESWLTLILWIAPMFSMKIFQNVQNITEHTGLTHENDTVHNTRTIKTWWIFRWMAWNMQYHTAHHTFPAVPFHALPELHKELVRHTGYEPPTTGYLAFQMRFIGKLLDGPESREGQVEINHVKSSAGESI